MSIAVRLEDLKSIPGSRTSPWTDHRLIKHLRASIMTKSALITLFNSAIFFLNVPQMKTDALPRFHKTDGKFKRAGIFRLKVRLRARQKNQFIGAVKQFRNTGAFQIFAIGNLFSDETPFVKVVNPRRLVAFCKSKKFRVSPLPFAC